VFAALLYAAALAGVEAEAQPGAQAPLRVGMSTGYAPLAFAEGGKPSGIEADLAQLLEPQLGTKLEIVQMPFTELIPALREGRIDIIMSGLSVTDERKASVRFTKPYLRVGQMALVRKADLVRAADPARMSAQGTRIGVKRGTTGEDFARASLGQATIVVFDAVAEGTGALRAGKVDYFVHDAPTIWRLTGRQATRDEALAGLYRPLTEEYLAWAVRKEDASLAERLDAALSRLEQEGKLQEVLDRWIPVTKVVIESAPSPRSP
jgi:polar amino acid transport system substrate-binding protein